MPVKQSNPNWAMEMNAHLAALDGVQTKVGLFDTAKYPDGTPAAQVAYWMEFGTKTAPPRPTWRPAAIKNENKWADTAALGANRVIEGKMSPFEAMEMLGQVIEGDVLKEFAAIQAPPLSLITLGARLYRQQGKKVTGKTIGEIARLLAEGKLDVSGVSTKPLNDTGYMISQITHLTESTK